MSKFDGLWYCAECGCIDVEEIAWVRMNSGEITNGEAPVSHWCPQCRSEETLVDFAPGAAIGDVVRNEFGPRRLHQFEGEAPVTRPDPPL